VKTKTTIEWVSGESPDTESKKLISITESDGRKRTSIGFMLDGNWFEGKGILPLIDEGSLVSAWAPLPVFDEEAEGQKVEFDDLYRCDNPNADKARFGRLAIAVEFIARILSRQIGSGFAKAGVHDRIELNRTIRRLNTIKGYIMEGEEAGL
jgi:hypothetical protein